MRAEWRAVGTRWRRFFGACLLILPVVHAWGAEAPLAGSEMSPLPVPVEAEAANQDLIAVSTAPKLLDEAIFTEISPLTIPEIGITLPADQEH
jgi:hypothetical protein